jgi:hypothetical protein
MAESLAAASASLDATGAASLSRSRFFVAMSGGFLLLVVLGFSPTFYLRAFFDVPQIPGYLYFHGAVLTAWFLGVFVQTLLIAGRNVQVHRRLGWCLAGLAIAVVALSLFTSLNTVPRRVAAGATLADLEPRIRFIAEVIWSNLLALVTFVILLMIGILCRRDASAHRRLMLLASLTLLSPSLTRIFGFSIFAGFDTHLLSAFGVFLLVIPLVAYDTISARRIHPATLYGGVLFVGQKALAMFVLATSASGQALVRSLAS